MKLPCHYLLALALDIDKDEVKFAQKNCVRSSTSLLVSIPQDFVHDCWLSTYELISGSRYRKKVLDEDGGMN